jgi:hypothetical protein
MGSTIRLPDAAGLIAGSPDLPAASAAVAFVDCATVARAGTMQRFVVVHGPEG